MAKVSLDDLRKGAPTARLERVYALCLRGDLMAEMDLLVQEGAAKIRAQAAEGEPQRLNPEAPERDTRAEELAQQIDDATGDLRLRAVPDGEWKRWINEHPPREKNQHDDELAFGLCNTDDLASDLGKWALSWNGDMLGADDWATLIAPNASGGDLKSLVNLVVVMQEQAEDPKLLLRVLRAGQSSSVSVPSPAQ